MPGHALQRLGGVDEFFHLGVCLIELPQGLAQAQRVLQGDMQRTGPGGHLLCDLVHLGVGHVHDPAHVPDDAPGRHGTEGDDLGHMVVAVLAADIVHHLAPAGIAEVHVDIRHTHPLRVQKSLEVQVIFGRIDIRNIQAVAHKAAGSAAASRAHGNTGFLGIADKVGDDEEIVRKAHLLDHVLLVPELLPVALIRAVAALVALVAELFQVGKAVVARRQLEFRQVVLAEGEFQVAHIRHLGGVGHCLLVPGKERFHLLPAAQVEVPGLIAHAVLVLQELTGLDAQQYVVGLRVLLAQVVGVVGAHHGPVS